ncbi:MAG: hypothetical protein ACJAUG_001501 [Halioglobus sp.]|jgi:hypothetical protein
MHSFQRTLTYGRSSTGTGATGQFLYLGSPPHPRKYLAFQLDDGGWNNILMQFEIMVVMAWITGRTLVLPPAKPLYLLGDTPRLLEDFLDLSELRRQLPVITAEEFFEFSSVNREPVSNEKHHDFMQTHAYTPPWNALDNMLVFPADALARRAELLERLTEPLRAGRWLIKISAEIEHCDLLYFPMTKKHRMFGVAECFYLFGDENLERQARTLLRDTIRFHEDIIKLADRAINAPVLAGTKYSAFHIRRGDFHFQYGQTQIGAKQMLKHTEALLSSDQPIYVATDEKNSEFLDAFRKNFNVVTFDSLPTEVVADTPDHWLGIIETLICAGAPGRFIGTRLSTFSTRIATLRGHLSHTQGSDCEGIDTALYYTQPPLHVKTKKELKPYRRTNEKHMDQLGETGLPWWLSKDPPWARAYRDCWAQTDD